MLVAQAFLPCALLPYCKSTSSKILEDQFAISELSSRPAKTAGWGGGAERKDAKDGPPGFLRINLDRLAWRDPLAHNGLDRITSVLPVTRAQSPKSVDDYVKPTIR